MLRDKPANIHVMMFACWSMHGEGSAQQERESRAYTLGNGDTRPFRDLVSENASSIPLAVDINRILLNKRNAHITCEGVSEESMIRFP